MPQCVPRRNYSSFTDPFLFGCFFHQIFALELDTISFVFKSIFREREHAWGHMRPHVKRGRGRERIPKHPMLTVEWGRGREGSVPQL